MKHSLVLKKHQIPLAPDCTTDKKKYSLGELHIHLLHYEAVSILIFSINMDMHEPNYLQVKEGILKANLYTH